MAFVKSRGVQGYQPSGRPAAKPLEGRSILDPIRPRANCASTSESMCPPKRVGFG